MATVLKKIYFILMCLSLVGTIVTISFGAFKILGLTEQSVLGFISTFCSAFIFLLFSVVYLNYERQATAEDVLISSLFYFFFVSFIIFFVVCLIAGKHSRSANLERKKEQKNGKFS